MTSTQKKMLRYSKLLEEWQNRWKYRTKLNCPSHLQDVVNDVTTWTINNNMKLNISKCKELIIDFAKDKRSFQPLTVSGNPIKLVESEKILALVVQNNLKWNLHVDNIVKKSSKRLYKIVESEILKNRYVVANMTSTGSKTKNA